MGIYINKGNRSFAAAMRSEYVDKSELILFVNNTINTDRRFTCVSRPRRFGKTMAAQMLYAYYDKSCDSRQLFDGLKVADPHNPVNSNDVTAYDTHINKYPTIYLDVTDFTAPHRHDDNIIEILADEVKRDIMDAYPDVRFAADATLMNTLLAIAEQTGEQFVMIIDEWDALCRELADKPHLMADYLNLLRSLFKGGNAERVFAAVYMTGVLPIQQDGTQSSLDNFVQYSMTNPEPLGEFFGFTGGEVQMLCAKHDMVYDEMAKWYEGYDVGSVGRVFCPASVMIAIEKRQYDSYWSRTSSFVWLREILSLTADGVEEGLTSLLQGARTRVASERFGDDVTRPSSADELFMLLVHYGYFTYDIDTREIAIPNQEIRHELLNVLRSCPHQRLEQHIKESDTLVEATLAMADDYVSKTIDRFSEQYVAPRFCSNEEALRGLLRYTYLAAINDYMAMENLPKGDGFYAVAYVPVRHSSAPVILVEIKNDLTADSVIKQVKSHRCPEVLLPYADNMLLVSIGYGKKTKKYSCKIEKYVITDNAEQDDRLVPLNDELAANLHKLFEVDKIFLRSDLHIDDVARMLLTNRAYVGRLMRQEYGLSFLEFVSVCRIQYSQRLLYSGNMSLDDVAEKSGFQSTSNYYRAFKRYIGSSPLSWLQQVKK